MSQLGQKRRFGPLPATSGLPLTSDMPLRRNNRRFVPDSDISRYSITSSAIANKVGGTTMPSFFAVC